MCSDSSDVRVDSSHSSGVRVGSSGVRVNSQGPDGIISQVQHERQP